LIITNNVLMEMARSIGLALPENDDSAIVIPNELVGIVLPMKPHEVQVAQATTPTSGSCWNRIGFLRTATGGSSTNMLTLTRGLWELNCSISAAFNYLEGSANASVYIELQPFSAQMVLASLTAGGSAATPCAVAVARKTLVLLPGNAPIRVVFNTNIAAQTMVGQAEIIANAILTG
jgi:hypothetical protein